MSTPEERINDSPEGHAQIDDKTRRELMSRYDLSLPLMAQIGNPEEVLMRVFFKARHPDDIIAREAATIRKSKVIGKGRTRVEFDSDEANADLFDVTVDYAEVEEGGVKQRYDTEQCKRLAKGVKIQAVDEIDEKLHFRVINTRQKGDFNFLFEGEEKPPVLVEQLFGDIERPRARFVHVIKYIEPGTRKRYRRESQNVESETKKGNTSSEMARNAKPGIQLYELTFDGIQDARYGETRSEDMSKEQLLNAIDPYWRDRAIDEAVEYLDNRGLE